VWVGEPVDLVTRVYGADARSPSYCRVFALLWNGKLLSDHHVSATRFRTSLHQEGLI